MRSVLAVIAGYLIFAVSSVFWFKITGQAPHQAAPVAFMAETLAYGAFFSLLAGWVCRAIAPVPSKSLIFLALLIFVFAGISMFTSSGSSWTQLLAMFVFAPVSLAGGYLHRRLFKK